MNKKIKKMKSKWIYDKYSDILFRKIDKQDVKYSRELENIDIIVDFDKNDEIVGIEIEGFMKAIIESQKKIDKIFKIANKTKQKTKRFK